MRWRPASLGESLRRPHWHSATTGLSGMPGRQRQGGCQQALRSIDRCPSRFMLHCWARVSPQLDLTTCRWYCCTRLAQPACRPWRKGLLYRPAGHQRSRSEGLKGPRRQWRGIGAWGGYQLGSAPPRRFTATSSIASERLARSPQTLRDALSQRIVETLPAWSRWRRLKAQLRKPTDAGWQSPQRYHWRACHNGFAAGTGSSPQ